MRPQHEAVGVAAQRLFSQPGELSSQQPVSQQRIGDTYRRQQNGSRRGSNQSNGTAPFSLEAVQAPHPAMRMREERSSSIASSALSKAERAEEPLEPGEHRLQVALDYMQDLNNFYPLRESFIMPWLNPELPFEMKSLAYMVQSGDDNTKVTRDSRAGLIKGTRCQPGALALEGRYEVICEGQIESLGGMDKSVYLDFIPLGNHVKSLKDVQFRQFTVEPKERHELGCQITMGSNLATFVIKGEVRLEPNVYALVLSNRGKTERFPQRTECTVRIRHVDGPSHYTPEPPKLQAVAFQHMGFRGRATRIGVGSHNSTTFGDSQMGSIRVPEGLKVTLFDRPNFRGRACVLTDDVSDLSRLEFKDICASVIVDDVRNNSGPQAWLYSLPQFQGRKTIVNLGKHPLGTFHRFEYQSAQVPPGVEVTLFEKKGFAGHKVSLRENTGDMRHLVFESAPCGIEVRVHDRELYTSEQANGWKWTEEKAFTPDTLGNGFGAGDARRLTARQQSERAQGAHNKAILDVLDNQRTPGRHGIPGNHGPHTPESPLNPHRPLPLSSPLPGSSGPGGRISAGGRSSTTSLAPREPQKESAESQAACLTMLKEDIESARITLDVQTQGAARRRGQAEEARTRKQRLEQEIALLTQNHERAMAALSEAHANLDIKLDQLERRGLASSQPSQVIALRRIKQRHRLLKRTMVEQYRDELETLQLEVTVCDRHIAKAESSLYDIGVLEQQVKVAEANLKQTEKHFDHEKRAVHKPGQNPEYVYQVGLQLWDVVASAERVYQARSYQVANASRRARAAAAELPAAEKGLQELQQRIAVINREIDLGNRHVHEVSSKRYNTKRDQDEQARKIGRVNHKLAVLTKERQACQSQVPMFQDKMKYANTTKQAMDTAKAELRESEKQLESALGKARSHDHSMM